MVEGFLISQLFGIFRAGSGNAWMWYSPVIKGIKRGEVPLRNPPPSPLVKGRGIKGEGLVSNLWGSV